MRHGKHRNQGKFTGQGKCKALWRFEALEARNLLSTGAVEPSVDETTDPVGLDLDSIRFDNATGTVEVIGGDELDLVTVELEGCINVFGQIACSQVRVTHEKVTANEEHSESFAIADVDLVVFHGHNHNDIFDNNTSIASEAYGGEGNDQLYGGGGRDTLDGEAGDDTVEGGDSPDDIYGGGGNDSLIGQKGGDDLHGGPGGDTLKGGDGPDELHGNDGDDSIVGGIGRDTLNGGANEDTLLGSDGNDQLNGGEDGDDLRGGNGNDTANGDAGDDLIEGGAGADTLNGGDNDDRLYGGDGNDSLAGGNDMDGLWGGSNVDTLTGGSGGDRFLIYDVKDSSDVITNKAAEDVQINFEDKDAERQDGLDYFAGVWSYNEIVELDEAFDRLAERTDNNVLLRTKAGNEFTFYRLGDLEPGQDTSDGVTFAWNTEGLPKITITGEVFDEFDADGGTHRDANDDLVHHAVWHEIAHEWDDEHDDWGDWKDLSGWSNPIIGPWNHDADIWFASSYAEENSPHEDFAETFALVMFDFNNEGWDDTELPGSNRQAKINHLNAFLNSL